MERSPQGVEGWGEVTALGEKGGGDLTQSGVGGKGSSLDGSGSHRRSRNSKDESI